MLGSCAVVFFSLSTVDTAADDFVIKILFQPWYDGSRVKSSGIRQYNFFFTHNDILLKKSLLSDMLLPIVYDKTVTL